jgi:hypothetical protein
MGLDNEFAMNLPQQSDVPWLVFDIETIPSPDAAQFLTEPIEAPSNWKDPLKIEQYIRDKRQKQIDEAGLDLDLCEVAAIGWEGPDNTGAVYLRSLCSEAHMLRDFWKAAWGQTLIGFNILHFDLLVLLRRSLYLGITPPPIAVDKYRHEGVIDLADTLSYGRRDLLRSLDFYCKRFGIQHDDTVSGADIARLVAAGDWKAVSAHCYDDVQATRALAERLKVIRPVTVAA